jgi:hypothetical protein
MRTGNLGYAVLFALEKPGEEPPLEYEGLLRVVLCPLAAAMGVEPTVRRTVALEDAE